MNEKPGLALAPSSSRNREGLAARLAWLLMLALVAFSRFGYLPAGPWEQDEALLAAGVVDFDPGHHMPHPPGFPLWVWIGRWVALLGVSDPLVALQLASALFSLMGVVALRALAEPLVGWALAMAASLVAAFLPGVWFHAARGFSETPSTAVFLVALALWVRSRERYSVVALFLLSAAALIRPPLAPFFAVVGLSWAWQVRAQVKTLAVATVASLALAMVTLVPLILEAGGWQLYWTSFATHAGEHAFLLGTEGASWASLGWVRGLGGSYLAAGATVLAALGWVALASRLGWRRWVSASSLGLWLGYLLLFTHNRTYPRYWVLAFSLAAVPLVAGLRVLLRREHLVLFASLALALTLGVWAYPAVAYTHRHPLPAVAAFLKAADDLENTVVFQDELFSFRSYLVRSKKLKCATLRVSEVRAPRFRLGGFKLFLVAESGPAYLPSSVSVVSQFRVASPQVVALSQDRFLQAVLVANPITVFAGGSVVEFEDGHPFVWLFPQATVLLPAVAGPGQVTLAVELPPDLPGTRVVARVDGTAVLEQTVARGRQLLTVPVPPLAERMEAGRVVPLELWTADYRKYPGDLRPLALKVSFVSVEAPPWRPRPYAVVPEEKSVHRNAVAAAGLYGLEKFREGAGAWCRPECRWELPLGPGRLGLWLSAPRPGGARLTAELGGNRFEGSVPPALTYVELPVPPEVATASRMVLRLSASAYEPPDDPRQLGVVVHSLGFSPGVPPLSPAAGEGAAALTP